MIGAVGLAFLVSNSWIESDFAILEAVMPSGRWLSDSSQRLKLGGAEVLN